MKRGLLCLCILAAMVLACSASDQLIHPPQNATESAQLTAADTAAPTGTASPTTGPTSTPRPTACVPSPAMPAALQSAQTEADSLIPGAKAIWYDDFICDELSYGWATGYVNPTLTATVSGGIVTIAAKEIPDAWDGLSRTATNLGDNKGMLVSFRYQENSLINLFIITGDWQRPNARRWGLDAIGTASPGPSWQGWEGTNWMGVDFPAKALRPGTWYYLLIRLGNAGQVTMKVWQKDNLENHADFQRNMGPNWTGRNWNPLLQVYKGMLELDEYWELAFNPIG